MGDHVGQIRRTLPPVIAGRHLGGQERREVVLPEGGVNPSCA